MMVLFSSIVMMASEAVSASVRKRVSLSRSACSLCFRTSNCPISAPIGVIISNNASSGCAVSRLKNSITPTTSVPTRIGKPKPLRSPSREIPTIRGNFRSEPDRHTAEKVFVAVDVPDCAHLPTQRFANRLQNFWRSFQRRARLRQQTSYVIFKREFAIDGIQLFHSCHSITIERKHCCANSQQRQHKEPRTSPEWRKNSERDCCRRRAGNAVRVDCAHDKAINARRKVRVADYTLQRWRAPITIGAFQFVLVMK